MAIKDIQNLSLSQMGRSLKRTKLDYVPKLFKLDIILRYFFLN